MTHTTIISPAELAEHLGNPDWAIFDCRFALGATSQGRQDYEAAHIPGAVYADLDEHLSGPIVPGVTGRHPLPDPVLLARRLSGWGVDGRVQVVAYDDKGGALPAARLWWLLRWLGHDAVAVLDGGWQAWQAAGYPVASGVEQRRPRSFVTRPRPEMVAEAEEVFSIAGLPGARVIDSRTADRYRGENETIDPVAGHIPGAANLPFAGNLDAAGRFLTVEELRSRFAGVLGDLPASKAVFYCGSGVSAAHNVLALAHADLGDARLYPGSWSEWITRKGYPVATGVEPDPA